MKKYTPIFLLSLCLSLYFFFSNPWLNADYYSESYSWFVDFSRTIFQPQSAYYAESILLPFIGRAIGASRSLIFYKSLCAALTLSILPVLGVLAQRYLHSFWKALVFIFLFGFSFQYFRYYILGFPDPLTILCLVGAVFQRRAASLFVLLTLAMLAHFSMANIGVLALLCLILTSPIDGDISPKKYFCAAIAAIIAGKLILLSWYWAFHYQLQSRLDWALGKGFVFFLDRYQLDSSGFWLTPGTPFLVLYGVLIGFFLLRRQLLFVSAAVVTLILAYLALFWTVDGLRVFAVIIAAPYAYLLIACIQSITGNDRSKSTS